MRSTMMDVPLSLNHLLERAGRIFGAARSCRACRTSRCGAQLRTVPPRHARAGLGAAVARLRPGERVATCAGTTMRTSSLLRHPGRRRRDAHAEPAPGAAEIGWIAADAQDRFLIVDDILLPLYRQFADLHRFERVIVFRSPALRCPEGLEDYEQLLAHADPTASSTRRTTRTTGGHVLHVRHPGRPKGVAYSHRSTVLHTLVGCLADFWGLKGTTC